MWGHIVGLIERARSGKVSEGQKEPEVQLSMRSHDTFQWDCLWTCGVPFCISGHLHGAEPQGPGGVLLSVPPFSQDHELPRNVPGVLQTLHQWQTWAPEMVSPPTVGPSALILPHISLSKWDTVPGLNTFRNFGSIVWTPMCSFWNMKTCTRWGQNSAHCRTAMFSSAAAAFFCRGCVTTHNPAVGGGFI